MQSAIPTSLTKKDFVSNQEPRWCPGCGDYAVLSTVQRVLPELGIPKERIVWVSGIGCSSRFPYYLDTFGIHTIHGRALPIATGIRTANPELSVWVATGDGDSLSIGGNHLLHCLRRNVEVKILLFNNRIYGLTKGQYSPTSELGKVTKTSPHGVVDHPVDPVSFALGCGATFVARTYDTSGDHLAGIIRRAFQHQGTAFIEILQNCPVFNEGAFDSVTDRASMQTRQLRVVHGSPLTFGPGLSRGLRFNPDTFLLEEVEAGDATPVASGPLVFDETNPMHGSLLARLSDSSSLPLPIGVLHAVSRPTYESLQRKRPAQTLTDGSAPNSKSNLYRLLRSGHTWSIG